MLKRFVREEEGATMVEYGLMVALIAVVCIVAIGALGGELRDLFTDVEVELSTAQTATPAVD
jgi:pilus assembly protein Flp/PilA